ncbi:unnamed protein product [Adineta ricciae]|uniref:Uncharacterized protein n=1 Tax=Adineta ricciae TaxID=249248 RepID=A0A815Q496_ADIRI|nr:unnamed protein product [Adineta ricciae]
MAKILFRSVLTENSFILDKMRKVRKCGRLIHLKNGSEKDIKVSEDGGSRSCSLINYSMKPCVMAHYHLRIFFIFTLGDYIRRLGLNGHHTIIYPCTSETILFYDLLYDLNWLMKSMDVKFSSFRTLILTAINKMKQQELIVNSNGDISVYDIKQILRRMKDEIVKTTIELKRNQSISEVDKLVLGQCDKVL